MTLSLGVLVSGSGSNLQAIIDRIEQGVLQARIGVVFSNTPTAYGLERARRHGIPHVALPHGEYGSRHEFDAAMVNVLYDHGVEAVVMAGFMRMVTPVLLSAFQSRVLNIHPALLPAFPGTHGARDANAYGVRLAGCTVHFVDEGMDSGPIVIQAAVPARAEDTPETLAARILTQEHRIYPQAIQWLAQGRLILDAAAADGRGGRQVRVSPPPRPAAMPCEMEALISPCLEDGF